MHNCNYVAQSCLLFRGDILARNFSASKMPLSVEMFATLRELFIQKSWPVDDSDGNSMFNWFCDRLSRLNEEQKKLVLELAQRYQRWGNNDYEGLLRDAFAQVQACTDPEIVNASDITIMPLLAPEDVDKSKSSKHVLYLCRSTNLKYDPFGFYHKCTYVEKMQLLPTNINQDPRKMIFLVDDFIGSGDTAELALNSIYQHGIARNKVAIVSLVAHQLGVNKLGQMNVKLFAARIVNKGITGYYSQSEELDTRIQIMKSIEKKMKIRPDLKFGYKGSEALVTMIRTPNNTFPVYWHQSTLFPHAPFPRN